MTTILLYDTVCRGQRAFGPTPNRPDDSQHKRPGSTNLRPAAPVSVLRVLLIGAARGDYAHMVSGHPAGAHLMWNSDDFLPRIVSLQELVARGDMPWPTDMPTGMEWDAGWTAWCYDLVAPLLVAPTRSFYVDVPTRVEKEHRVRTAIRVGLVLRVG